MIRGQVQQGDILITPLDRSPFATAKRGRRVPPKGGRVILAEGSATGNAHALPAGDADLYELDPVDPAARIMVVHRDTTIVHGGSSIDHAPLPVIAGEHAVQRQESVQYGFRTAVED